VKTNASWERDQSPRKIETPFLSLSTFPGVRGVWESWKQDDVLDSCSCILVCSAVYHSNNKFVGDFMFSISSSIHFLVLKHSMKCNACVWLAVLPFGSLLS